MGAEQQTRRLAPGGTAAGALADRDRADPRPRAGCRRTPPGCPPRPGRGDPGRPASGRGGSTAFFHSTGVVDGDRSRRGGPLGAARPSGSRRAAPSALPMKCPKCGYIGFEAAERCRNCGYDFSLAVERVPVPDMPLAEREEASPLVDLPLGVRADAGSASPALEGAESRSAGSVPAASPGPDLPLFAPGHGDDDRP